MLYISKKRLIEKRSADEKEGRSEQGDRPDAVRKPYVSDL